MEDKGKGVAEGLRGYDGTPGCAPVTIARLAGLDEPRCHDRDCGSCLGLTLSALADAIDAELAAAREASARDGMAIIAAAEGWPAMRDGESVVEWMARCWLPRPRYEDGEPVQSSDMEEIGALATCRVYMDGSWVFFPDKYEDEANPKPWDSQSGTRNDRIKRPAPKVFDADGVPVKVGDTVWFCGDDSGRYTVSAVEPTLGGNWCLTVFNDAATIHEVRPSQVKHHEPDSLKKLRDDMRREMTESPDARFMDSSWVDRLTALIERGL